MIDKLPIRINPCPIIEAIVEVRFSSALPAAAIYGILYSKINAMFTSVKNLPILQIPEAIRSTDPNLMYQPHYLLANGDLSLRVGPRALVFVNSGAYQGWAKFSPFIINALEGIRDTQIIHLPERIGIRYMNFFNHSILDKVDFKINYQGNPIDDENITTRIEFKRDEFIQIINIANNSGLNINNKIVLGSLIDIDCIYNYQSGTATFYDSYKDTVEAGHLLEKTSFFKLLLPSFLESLNPIYGEEN